MKKGKVKACRHVDGPRLTPIRLSRTAWYYEETHGLTVVAEKRDESGELMAVTQTKLPWRKLESSMSRRPGKGGKR